MNRERQKTRGDAGFRASPKPGNEEIASRGRLRRSRFYSPKGFKLLAEMSEMHLCVGHFMTVCRECGNCRRMSINLFVESNDLLIERRFGVVQ
jgi:hypothetical protein